jgi:hypothetical protein
MRKSFIANLSILFLLTAWHEANAQSAPRTPRLEFGSHFTMMTRFDATHGDVAELTLEPEEFSRNLNLGVGVRATFNLNRYVGFETEWNALPQDSEYAGRKSQWLYGMKLGIRKAKYGIFAKARPGFMYFSKDYCDGFPDLNGSYRCLGSLSRNPALDLGGVLELYSKGPGVIRIDIGDTAVRFNNVNRYRQELGPPLNFANQVYGGRTHNLQVSIGIAFKALKLGHQ